MKLLPNFDPERNRVLFNLECNLLTKYYPNFAGLLLNSPNVPKGINVERDGKSSAVISFPMGECGSKDEANHVIAIDHDRVKGITDIITNFINESLSQELKTTEFLPLNGYPVESLKEDVKAAVKAKRTLCIIGEYSEYLAMNSQKVYKFHQVMVSPETEEYADVALMLHNDEFEQLKEIYLPKLTLVDWC